MKRVLVLFLIVIVCAMFGIAFLACDRAEKPQPVSLEQWMDAEDIFDLLDKSFSYTISVGNENYRFIRGVGYTKFEEGVFDGLVADEKEGCVYRMRENGENVTVVRENLTNKFYDEVDELYFYYVNLLRDSFDNMTSKRPVEFDITDEGSTAIIKIINSDKFGEYRIVECRISNVNNTILFFTEKLKTYKTLAVDA